MGNICGAISGRLDLVFFFYGLSFAAMGLLLFVQPKRATSFALTDSFCLLGWFGAIHGANEFLDMWSLIRPVENAAFGYFKFSVLFISFLFLLEFARRAGKALVAEAPVRKTVISWLLGPLLVPVLAAAALGIPAFWGTFIAEAPAITRLLLGFPGAALAGTVFLAYARAHGPALLRLKVRKHFILAGTSFLLYSVLIQEPTGQFPANIFNTAIFLSVTDLPVQLFRAICAVAIFCATIGMLRIFRESALQAAQQELLDIIEFFPDATFVINKEKKIIAWNRALETMTGVPKAQMLGKGDFAYSVPFYGDRRPVLIDLIGAPHPEAEKLYEYVEKRPDGAIYAEVFVPSLYNGKGAHVWVTASPLQDKSGAVYGAIESVRDITDRRRSEKLVKESEDKFRTLTEKSLVGVYLIQNGLFKYVNPKMAEIFGYSADELIGKKGPRDTVLKDDWPIVQENLRKRLDGEIPEITYSFCGVRKDGTQIYVEVFGSRTDYRGGPAVLGTLLDITERKKTENALMESEARYKTLVDNAQVGIVVHHAGVMRFINQKMAGIVRGSDSEQVLGRNVLEFMHPDYREFSKERIRRSMAEDLPMPPAEEKLVAMDGTTIDVEINTVPITYLGERCAMAIVQDITARKKAERELREANVELERRVQERTRQFEEANKELEAFSYSAAHDLKAPLRRINIFAEMLEKEAGAALKGEPGGYLLNIRKSVTQMTDLVKGLLTLSTTGRKTLEFEPVQLSALLEESISEVKAETPGREIEWKTPALPEVKCDRAMMKQVFLNLLGNAVKYTRGRTPAIIEISYALKDGEHVVGVRDNGVGFNMEHADKLFDVFQRLHKAEEFEGTGIGLSTVRRIILRHGGRVWAESSRDKGAAFYFSLPGAG
jgi:PAS domain S-box-containing protein